MALHLDDDAETLARELAELTGETLEEAVLVAVRERLERDQSLRPRTKRERMLAAVRAFQALPVIDERSADEILGYDANGLPS